jgi:hypothetical protein
MISWDLLVAKLLDPMERPAPYQMWDLHNLLTSCVGPTPSQLFAEQAASNLPLAPPVSDRTVQPVGGSRTLG